MLTKVAGSLLLTGRPGLRPGPVLALLGTWRTNQQTGNLCQSLSLSVTFHPSLVGIGNTVVGLENWQLLKS